MRLGDTFGHVSLLRRRAKSRSCRLHGDNGCEIQGEAGLRERSQDQRAWRAEARWAFEEYREACIYHAAFEH